MKAKLWSFFLGLKQGDIDLALRIFGGTVNRVLLDMALNVQLSNNRQGTAGSKNRSAVKGTTRKPWAQKKTGRARAGDCKSPLWRGGGVIFGPHPRSYRVDLPKKMRQSALFSVFSLLAKEEKLIILSDVLLDGVATSVFFKKIKPIVPQCEGVGFRCVLILTNRGVGKVYDFIRKSARNLPWLTLVHVDSLELKDLYYADRVIFVKPAYDELVARYAL